MVVTCPDCSRVYDDTYKLTFCPHDEFGMRTVAVNNGESKICTTIEELNEFMGWT